MMAAKRKKRKELTPEQKRKIINFFTVEQRKNSAKVKKAYESFTGRTTKKHRVIKGDYVVKENGKIIAKFPRDTVGKKHALQYAKALHKMKYLAVHSVE